MTPSSTAAARPVVAAATVTATATRPSTVARNVDLRIRAFIVPPRGVEES
jgi:hypothetical protein